MALGLSLVAATRCDPQKRLEYAEAGLLQQPDFWTHPYLLCSAARARVELGQAPTALVLVRQALLVTTPEDLRGRARGLYYLQGVHAALEQYTEQERVAREALRLFDLLGVEGERTHLLQDLAYRRFYQGDACEAHALLGEVIQAHHTPLPIALLLRAEFSLLQGRISAALTDLEVALAVHHAQGQDHLTLVLQAYRLECQWRLGTLDEAAFMVGTLSLFPLSAFDESVAQFYRGVCAFLGGHLEEARAAFGRTVEGVALLDSFRLRASAYLLEIARQQGRLVAHSVDALVKLLETVGGDLALECDAPRLAPLYQALAAHRWGGYRVARLALAPETGPERVLEVHTLGRLQVSFQGEPLNVRLAKGRELLVWLALHGPGTRDTMLEALWEGESPVRRSSYLKQAIRSVRDALSPLCRPGEEALEFQAGRYRLNPAWTLKLDVTALLEGVDFGPQ